MTEQTDPKSEPKANEPSTDVLSQLTAAIGTLTTQMASIQERLDKQEPEKSPQAVPTPTPPAAPQGRADQAAQTQYLRDLQTYAAQQTQEAARYRIAGEAGIDPKRLEGSFPDEAAMRLRAIQLADMDRLERLAKETQERIDKFAVSTTTVDVSPVEDTGASSGKKQTEESKLDDVYEQARKNKRVDAYLETIYRDSRKVIGKGPLPEL